MERINTSQVDEFGFDIDTTFSFNQFKENLYSSQQRLNGYDKKLDYLLELDEEIKLFGIPIPKTEEQFDKVSKYISLKKTFEFLLEQIYDFNIDIVYFDFDINTQFNPLERYYISVYEKTGLKPNEITDYSTFVDELDNDIYKFFSQSRQFIDSIESVYKPFYLFRITEFPNYTFYYENVNQNSFYYIENNVIYSKTVESTVIQNNNIYQNSNLIGNGIQTVNFDQFIEIKNQSDLLLFSFNHTDSSNQTFYNFIDNLLLDNYKTFIESYSNIFANYMYLNNLDISLYQFIKKYLETTKQKVFLSETQSSVIYPSRYQQLNNINVGFYYVNGQEEICVLKIFDYQIVDRFYTNFIIHNILKQAKDISNKYLIKTVNHNQHYEGKALLEEYLNGLQQNELILDYRVNLNIEGEKAEFNVYIKDRNIPDSVFQII